MPADAPRYAGWLRLGVAVAVGLTLGLLHVVPVRSQTLHLEALKTTEKIPFDDPWAEVWERAGGQEVPLSAQNITPPFGGGGVAAVTARALHDGERLFLLLEWADREVDDAVNSVELFSDAAAVQFPAISGTAPPYTMGAPDVPVNIWQWKAVWEADLASGFATTQDHFPNTYVDYYPEEGPLYRPAEEVGNPLAQPSHPSSIENLLAEGFGSLTTAPIQNLEGSGEWRSGRWRALFVRDLSAEGGYAQFTIGEPTMVAFAVWDGGEGDRNGQKSIAPFVDLTLSSESVGAPVTPSDEAGGFPWWVAVLIVAVVVVFVVRLATLGGTTPGPRIRVVEVPPEEESDG